MSAKSSSTLDPGEQAILIHIGTSTLGSILGVIVESILWTVGVMMFFWAIRLQTSSQKPRTRTRIVLLVITIYLTLSSTALWAMNVSWIIIGTKTYFLNVLRGIPLEEINELRSEELAPLGLPMELMFLLNMIVGDSVVIWRAWVICSGQRRLQRLVFIPIAMLLTSFAFTVISVNCLNSDGFSGATANAVGTRTCEWGEPIAWAISLLTNFTSTSLIAAVAWQHRQILKEGRIIAHKSRSEQILITLVESGFIYCLVWLTQLDIFMETDYGYTFKFFLQNFLAPFGDQIPGIYAMGIIILVNKQNSISDLTQLSASAGSQPSTLVFTPSEQNESTTSGRHSTKREDTHSYAMRDLDLQK